LLILPVFCLCTSTPDGFKYWPGKERPNFPRHILSILLAGLWDLRPAPMDAGRNKRKASLERFFERLNPHLRSSLIKETQFTRRGMR